MACTPCTEPCVWKCVHLRCTKLCMISQWLPELAENYSLTLTFNIFYELWINIKFYELNVSFLFHLGTGLAHARRGGGGVQPSFADFFSRLGRLWRGHTPSPVEPGLGWGGAWAHYTFFYKQLYFSPEPRVAIENSQNKPEVAMEVANVFWRLYAQVIRIWQNIGKIEESCEVFLIQA